MPRNRNEPNAIVGSARRINLARKAEVEKLRDRTSFEWQRLAWRHYDAIGEIKYGFNYFAQITSRVRLLAGYQTDDAETPAPIGDVGGLDRDLVNAARYELNKLFNGPGGAPNFIRTAVLNLLVAGECHLLGQGDKWSIRSNEEIVPEANNRVRLRERQSEPGEYLAEDDFIARIWRTHPKFSAEADSSLRGVEEACQELLLLSRIIRVSGQSRLNAGIMYVADELRFQRSVDPSGDTAQPDTDPFEEELILSLTEPVEGESQSEIIPMIIRGPAELAETAIKMFDISRGFDDTILERHEKTLNRVLDGIDLPKEFIQGMSGVRYSNAQTISQDLLKAHIEPMILLLCEALTTVYLRPALIARGYDLNEVNRVHVWYDPSEVVTKPDRSEDADKGYGRMLISGAAWRRAHGFSEADAPTDEELALRVALSGSVAPSTTLDFLRQVAPDLVKEAEQLAQQSFGDPTRKTEPSDLAPQDTPDAQPAIPQSPPETTPPAPEPPEGTLPPPEPFSVRDAQVLHLLKQFAAAKAARPSDITVARNKKLERALGVERELREAVYTHLNDVVARALEKAGARTISKVRNDAELKPLVAAVAVEEALAQIPADRLAEFGLEDQRKLVRDTIDRARSSFEGLIKEAQARGWRALGIYEKMRPNQDANVAKAWDWLASRLVEAAAERLRNPDSQAAYVDMGLVRKATAVAGGGSPDSPVDSGRAVLSVDAITQTEWDMATGFKWVHHFSENEFEPHQRLDDKVFDSWDVEELSAPSGEFPYVTHYYPGDHTGCRCDWLPVVIDQPAKVGV
jgi:hypothetical protein